MSDSSAPRPGQENQAQIRVRVQETHMASSYANAFRTHRSAEEVVLDFGLRIMQPTQQSSNAPADGPRTIAEMSFDVSSRVVMNYATAKRLTLALGQIIQQHEQQHGEIKLGREQQAG